MIKLIHMSDLHLGKRVNDFPMIEDQRYILKTIINIIDEEKPEGILIAGDVYDKSVPPVEAVELLEEFLTYLTARNLPVYMVSGNHDSVERLSFGAGFLKKSGIHIAKTFHGNLEGFELTAGEESLNIYLLPFIKPANVRPYFEEEINSYTDAIRLLIENAKIDESRLNILVAHQFVAGAELSQSEDIISVGGTDNVDPKVFSTFDYVALGHIHRPQRIYRDTIRYSGTPLKYSLSEIGQDKSLTVVEINGKDDIVIKTRALIPKKDMRKIRGTYEELMLKSNYENTNVDDYIHAVLTDEEEKPDAISYLRNIYNNIMKLQYDNSRTRTNNIIEDSARIENKTPGQLTAEFFELQNNQPMNEKQTKLLNKMIEKIWGE